MTSSRMLRVHSETHAAFLAESRRRGATVDAVARDALRALHREALGRELAEPLGADEQRLDADLG